MPTAFRWNHLPEQILSATSDVDHAGDVANAVQRQRPKTKKETAPQQPPVFAITIACLVKRLAGANNPMDGRETKRLGVSRGHGVQLQGRSAFLTR